jgi:hypothetical protein
MDLTITRLNGTSYTLSSYGVSVLDFKIAAPSPRFNYDTVEFMDGNIDLGSDLGPRTITASLEFVASDYNNFPVLRNTIFSIFLSNEAFWLVDDREPNRKWLVKAKDFTPEQIVITRGRFDVEFIAAFPFAESIGTTLQDTTFSNNYWKDGSNNNLSKSNYSVSISSGVPSLTTKPATTTNLAGKISGSTVENANIAKRGATTSLYTPSTVPTEFTQTELDKMKTIDGVSASNGNSTNGYIYQHMFSFNLIAAVEKTFGTIPVTDKVAWLKANITTLTCNWYGFGSSPNGNKAYLTVWDTTQSIWGTSATNTASTPTKTVRTAVQTTAIDSNGFIYFLAYADAANGAVASTINTDYIELIVEVNLPNIYNAGQFVVDPRERSLKITFTGASTNLQISNMTTGDTWTYSGTTTASDVVLLDGIRSLKNGLTIFSSTNRKLIKMNAGNNYFYISGASGTGTITFEFSYLTI